MDHSDEQTSWYEQSSTTAAMAVSLVALILTIACLLLRIGYDDVAPRAILSVLGCSWFLIHFPWAAGKAIGFFGPTTTTWYRSQGMLSLVGLFVLVIAGMLAANTAWHAAPTLAVAGVALYGVRWLAWIWQQRPRTVLLWTAAIVLLALFLVGNWGDGYANPLFVPALAEGIGHRDALFHSAVCSMIQTYGVPSTGLDGTPLLYYHWGSHWVFAQFSQLLGIGPLDFYNIAFPILIVPFFLQAILTLAIAMADARGAARSGIAIISNPGVWLLFMLGVVRWVPPDAARDMGLLNSSITSESMCLALAISLLGLSAGVTLVSGAGISPADNALADWKRAPLKLIAAAIFFPVLLAVIGMVKISLMLILLGVAVLATWRLRLYRHAIWVAGLVLAGVLCYFSYRTAMNPYYQPQSGMLKPFGFVGACVHGGWESYHLLTGFAWLWFFSWLRWRQAGIRTLGDLLTAVRERRILDWELLAAVALLGFIPAVVLRGSATFFFLDFQRWIGVAMVLSMVMTQMLRHLIGVVPAHAAHRAARLSWKEVSLLSIFVGFIMFTLNSTMVLSTGRMLKATVAANVASRGLEAKDHPARVEINQHLKRLRLRKVAQVLREQAAQSGASPHSSRQLLQQLKQLAELPVAEKRRSLLYIPPDHPYWQLLNRQDNGRTVAMLAPAMTGIALIDGVPAGASGEWAYGYDSYFGRPQSRQTLPEEEQLRRLAHQGDALVGHMLRVRRLDDGQFEVVDVTQPDAPHLRLASPTYPKLRLR